MLSGGDNVSPARVEGFLVLQPEIAQAMVHGDRHPHLVALLVPDADFAKDWAARNNGGRAISPRWRENPAFTRAVGAAVDRVNSKLVAARAHPSLRRAAGSFTIDNAMLTPSLKIRRHKIRETLGRRAQEAVRAELARSHGTHHRRHSTVIPALSRDPRLPPHVRLHDGPRLKAGVTEE